MQSTHLLAWDPRVPTLEGARVRGIFLEFYDPHGRRFGLPTYPFHWAPDGLHTIRQLRAKNLRPGGQEPAAQIMWRYKGRRKNKRCVAYLYRIELALPKRTATPAQRDCHRKGAGRPPHLPHLRDAEGLLHSALTGRMQRLRGRGLPMMALPSSHRSGVNRSLTPKRHTRITENNQPAASCAALSAPTAAASAPVTSTPSPT